MNVTAVEVAPSQIDTSDNHASEDQVYDGQVDEEVDIANTEAFAGAPHSQQVDYSQAG